MQEWLQIVIGVGAAVMAVLLFTIIVLFIKLNGLRKENTKIKKNGINILPQWRKDSTISLTSTFQNAPNSDPLYRWNSEEMLETKGSQESLYSSSEILYSGDEHRNSFLSPNSNSPANNLREVPVSATEDDSSKSPKQSPRIEFHLLYVQSTSTLRVRVVRVNNLSLRYRKNCSSFVKVSLLARRKSSVQTNVIHNSLNPEYEEWFDFPGYNMVELRQYTLRFIVYVKLYGNLKKKFVGDLFYPISKNRLNSDTLLTCTEFIASRAKKNREDKSEDLGQLFVLLQYQSSAERMKVFIRKAENLPKTKSLFVQPDHYVIVSLVRSDEAIIYNETRTAAGLNPVWNQPFLFDIPSEDANKFRLQFVIMRGRIYTRDGIIGQVAIGPNTNPMGIAHWQDAMLSRAQEVAKWHHIQTL